MISWFSRSFSTFSPHFLQASPRVNSSRVPVHRRRREKTLDSSPAAKLQDLLPSINQLSRLRDVIKGAPEPCNRTACASFGLRLWWRITPVQLPVQPLLPCCRRRDSLPFLDCISMHKLRVLHAYFKPLLPHLNTL
jgi:hypothetical protein